ncbi:MAG: aminotransferase class I/II-fold pyridoxal phosphate-dependent enzyme [Myxococcota bacterium]
MQAVPRPAHHGPGERLQARYDRFKALGLALDMSRGKPCQAQLELSAPMLSILAADDHQAVDGMDCRNYGGLEGLPEARGLFAQVLGVDASEVVVGGNSSLELMYETLVVAFLQGVPGGDRPWCRGPVRFLCPTPGYDRHFAICEHLRIDMIPVDMLEDGPDMDRVEGLVADDDRIKGIWCVPRFSNPTGATVSDAVVRRLAAMRTRARDFRIFWDDAYAVHPLEGTPPRPASILSACRAAGNPDRVYLFGSTSKVTLAGAGVAFMGSSEENLKHLKRSLSVRTIGPDKLNQLRHTRFLQSMSGIEAHMRRHAAILKPKFDAVHRVLEAELGGKGLATWTRPAGGYFISLNTLPGCVSEVVAMAAAAGVKLTPAGSTYPYGRDPLDRNIRIAPSFPAVKELERATELLSICIQEVSRRKGLR